MSSAASVEVATQTQIHADVTVTRLPLPTAFSVVDAFDSLTGRDRSNRRAGAVLLESADRADDEGRRSLLLPDPVLRLTVVGDEVSLEPLGEAARLSVDRIVIDHDSHLMSGSSPIEVPTDDVRLKSPSPLDHVRRLMATVRDVDDGEGVNRAANKTKKGSARALPITVAGAYSFDIIDHFEELPPRQIVEGHDDADIDVVLALDGIVVDHETKTATVVTRTLSGPGIDGERERERAGERHRRYVAAVRQHPSASSMSTTKAESTEARAGTKTSVDLDDDAYRAGVRRLLDHIAAGDVFQTVLSRALVISSSAVPLEVYRELRRRNPSPSMFFYELRRGTLLGASPETCVRVVERRVSVMPIAGTTPRGVDEEQDLRLEIGLRLDPKEQAEHAMLVDLARNDVARISQPGTRRVEAPLEVRRFSHVQHLVSQVSGTLRDDLDALHAFRAAGCPGTLSGAPKLRAVELLRETEGSPRGFYGGAVGYLTADGDLDTCIVIRALRHRDGQYTARAGAGIVRDSDPDRELAEVHHKMSAVLSALTAAEAKS